MRPARRPPLRLFLVAWVPLAAIYAALFLASGAGPALAVRSSLASVLPFLLLGLLVLHVPGRWRWRDEGRAAFAAAQLGLAAAYAVLGTAGVMALRALDSLAATGRARVRMDAMSTAWQALFGALIYLVIAGAAYAWHNAEGLRAEAARAAQAEALRARAELCMLRSQLNPHFLLNTLHAALGLVRRDPAKAEHALERLGEVLHYGLRTHREALDEVTLADEWAFVRSYLEIESLRLEERLQLRMEADPETMAEPVPPFVLQPLVENAILHAIAPRAAGGRVVITARRRDGHLVLEVADDGPGLSSSPPSGNGLGLRLLRERLALLYAGRARLELLAAERGGGLRARIDVPLDREAPGDPA
jgi:signal transduction histidine kinase